MKPTFKLGDRLLSEGSAPYVVAEIGVNHNGDLDLAKSTIDAAVKAGADAVKFQTFRAEEFMADKDMVYEYEQQGELVAESMYAMFKRLELPESWHEVLQRYAEKAGVEFLSSVADAASADLLKRLGAPALKVASEDLINLPLLEYVAGMGIPVILSTGMGDREEIDLAMETLREGGCPDILLLHCVSLYPTPPGEANLLRIAGLRERYGCLVGYSDHTQGWQAAVLAVALGAVLIEKHFTLDRGLPGPDHSMSSDPDELSTLVSRTQDAKTLLGVPDLRPSPGEEARSRREFRRSIVAARDIPEGVTLTREMLSLKRPGTGLHPRELSRLLGMRTRRAFQPNEAMEWDGLG